MLKFRTVKRNNTCFRTKDSRKKTSLNRHCVVLDNQNQDYDGVPFPVAASAAAGEQYDLEERDDYGGVITKSKRMENEA